MTTPRLVKKHRASTMGIANKEVITVVGTQRRCEDLSWFSQVSPYVQQLE
jgi:hypothetical protein